MVSIVLTIVTFEVAWIKRAGPRLRFVLGKYWIGFVGLGRTTMSSGAGESWGRKNMVARDLANVDSGFVAIDKADRDRETVLVVEDDESYQDALRTGLTREGYEIEVAGTGIEALRRFADNLPDLVLLDVLLPDVSGIEVCRRMMSLAPVPIIMVSALGAEQDIVSGLDLGAMDYVTKPYRLREIGGPHALGPPTLGCFQASSVDESRDGATTSPSDLGCRSHSRGLVQPGRYCQGQRGCICLVESSTFWRSCCPPDLVRTRGELVDSLWFGSDLSDTRNARHAHSATSRKAGAGPRQPSISGYSPWGRISPRADRAGGARPRSVCPRVTTG